MRSHAVYEHSNQSCRSTMSCKNYVTLLSIYGTVYGTSTLSSKYPKKNYHLAYSLPTNWLSTFYKKPSLKLCSVFEVMELIHSWTEIPRIPYFNMYIRILQFKFRIIRSLVNYFSLVSLFACTPFPGFWGTLLTTVVWEVFVTPP